MGRSTEKIFINRFVKGSIAYEKREIEIREEELKIRKAENRRIKSQEYKGKALKRVWTILWKKEVSELKPKDLLEINSILQVLCDKKVRRRWIYDNCDIDRKKLDKVMAGFSWWRGGRV